MRHVLLLAVGVIGAWCVLSLVVGALWAGAATYIKINSGGSR